MNTITTKRATTNPATIEPRARTRRPAKDREALRAQYARVLAKLHEAEDRLDARRRRLSAAFRAAFERNLRAA